MTLPISQSSPITPPQQVGGVENHFSSRSGMKNKAWAQSQAKIQAELLKALFRSVHMATDQGAKHAYLRFCTHRLHELQAHLAEQLAHNEQGKVLNQDTDLNLVQQLVNLVLLHKHLSSEIEVEKNLEHENEVHEHVDDKNLLQEKMEALLLIEEKIERLCKAEQHKLFHSKKLATEEKSNEQTNLLHSQNPLNEKEERKFSEQEKSDLESLLNLHLEEQEQKLKVITTYEKTEPERQQEKQQQNSEKEMIHSLLRKEKAKEEHASVLLSTTPQVFKPPLSPYQLIASLFIPPSRQKEKEEQEKKKSGKKQKKSKKQKKRSFKKILKRAFFGSET